MNALPISLLANARAFLIDDYLSKIERCLDALDEESIWWRANPESNSIGNLMRHLNGSTRIRVLGVRAGHRVIRDRDAAFSERGPRR